VADPDAADPTTERPAPEPRRGPRLPLWITAVALFVELIVLLIALKGSPSGPALEDAVTDADSVAVRVEIAETAVRERGLDGTNGIEDALRERVAALVAEGATVAVEIVQVESAETSTTQGSPGTTQSP